MMFNFSPGGGFDRRWDGFLPHRQLGNGEPSGTQSRERQVHGSDKFSDRRGGALARLEGPGIDFFNNASNGAWYGYKGMFIFAAVCTVASLLLLPKTKIQNNELDVQA